MARPVFVVSTGRSGSTLISNLLRKHPDVLSLSEFFILLGPGAFPEGPVSGTRFWRMLSEPDERLRSAQRSTIEIKEFLYRPGPRTRFNAETGIPPIMLVTLPHLVDDPEALFDELAAWAPGLDPRPIGDQYRRLFAWLTRRLERTVWVERSGLSLPLLPALSRLFPEAGFVHLYRDGRECAMSMSRHVGFRRLALHSRPELEEARRQAGSDPDAETIDRIEMRPEMFGKIWSDMVVEGVAHLRELPPGRVRSISYESLLADPSGQLRRLAAFIGVAASPDWLRDASALPRRQPLSWPRLPEPQQRRLMEACAPGLELLYGPAPGDFILESG